MASGGEVPFLVNPIPNIFSRVFALAVAEEDVRHLIAAALAMGTSKLAGVAVPLQDGFVEVRGYHVLPKFRETTGLRPQSFCGTKGTSVTTHWGDNQLTIQRDGSH